MRFVALDVETTGLNSLTDRIVEIGMVIGVWGKDCMEISWLINPGMKIPEEAIEVHGITDKMVAGMPPFRDFANALYLHLQTDCVIAYNAGFDLAFIDSELRRAGLGGLPPIPLVIDPLQIFRDQFGHSLDQAVQTYLGREMENAHRALEDTKVLPEILAAQLEIEETDDIRELGYDPGPDPTGKILADEETGELVFGFGKHKGEPVLEHSGYCRWMLEREFAQSTKEVIRRVWNW